LWAKKILFLKKAPEIQKKHKKRQILKVLPGEFGEILHV
jgi:hypothetical protein